MENKEKRKVCVLTGTRSEYGLLRPVMRAIQNHPALELKIIATGMHLSPEWGYTIQEIIKDGFPIAAKVEMNSEKDTGAGMAQGIGRGIIGITKAFEEIKPEILVILGDRIEALAATIAAVYMNIPVAHLHGGEKSAGVDESVRHAITKLAKIHFPATQKSAERIIKMGENENHVFIVGAPCLDTILNMKTIAPAEIEKKFGLDLQKPFILVVQHPVTIELEKTESQIIETLEAIKMLQYQTIIIYPNSDAGGRIIIKHIEKNQNLPFLKIWKNMPQEDYFSLLKHASVLIGNSSSGVIESSSFRLPVVNLGIRQEGRERSNNIIDANHERQEILAAIRKALSPDFRKSLSGINPYGDGKTGPRIAKILAELKIDQELIQKQISY